MISNKKKMFGKVNETVHSINTLKVKRVFTAGCVGNSKKRGMKK